MKNLFLALLAIMLFIIIEPISFIYVIFFKSKFHWKRISGYWRDLAVNIDRFGNYHFRSLWNATLKTNEGYLFGNFQETISSALGKNQLENTLTPTGKILVFILNLLDENHCINSINYNV